MAGKGSCFRGRKSVGHELFEHLLLLSIATAPLACSTSSDAGSADTGAPTLPSDGGLDAKIAADPKAPKKPVAKKAVAKKSAARKGTKR